MSEGTSMVFIKGVHVTLRPLCKEDLPSCARWINDPEIRDFMKSFWPITIADEEEWFASLGKKKGEDLLLAIEADGKYIGNIGLHNISWRSRIATTGTLIGEKDCRGRGLGTEAKILLLHHAFISMNLRKICSQAVAFNERSIAYSKKCGYKEEGRLKEHVFRRGQYWDMVNLAVFWEDFKPVWDTYRKTLNQP